MHHLSYLRLRKHLMFGLAVIFLMAGAISTKPVAAATATLEPTTVTDGTTVKAGSTFVVRGSGFSGDDRISTWASYSLRPTVYPTAGGNADSGGNISLTIKVGRFWEPGWWAITVSSPDETRKAVVNFKVESSPPDGLLDYEPRRDVRGGERVLFHGAGYNVDDSIKVWITRPDGTAFELLKVITRREKEVFFFYDIPLGASPGRWSATAYGQGSERLMIRDFNVAP